MTYHELILGLKNQIWVAQLKLKFRHIKVRKKTVFGDGLHAF